MKKENSLNLSEKLNNALVQAPKTVKEPLHVKRKVGIAIYWLASSAEYWTIGNCFGVATTYMQKLICI